MPLTSPTLLLAAILSLVQAAPVLAPDTRVRCDDCEAWNRPREPFRVFGNTYFVRTDGLSAVLVTSEGASCPMAGCRSPRPSSTPTSAGSAFGPRTCG